MVSHIKWEDILHDNWDNTSICNPQPLKANNSPFGVHNPQLIASLAHPASTHTVITLVQPLGPEPLLDSGISHVNAVDIEPTICLGLESVLFLDLGRVPDERWVFSTTLEFHPNDGVGEGLRLEDLYSLFDGFDTDTDIIRVRKVPRVNQRCVSRIGRPEADGAAG